MAELNLGNFTLALPDEWYTKLLAVCPPLEDFKPNEPSYQPSVIINFHPRKPGTDLDTVLKEQITEMKVVLRSFKENKREFIEVSGQKGAVIDFSFVQQGMMLRQLNCFVLHGEDRMLIMNASHLMGKRFDQMRPKFIEVFKGVKIPPA
jgi:hypothetical protein